MSFLFRHSLVRVAKNVFPNGIIDASTRPLHLSSWNLVGQPSFRFFSQNGSGETQKPAEPSPEQKLAEKDTKIKELSDSYLLILADMENLRNRTKREVESASQFAIAKFSKDIISVADVLEMALKSVDPEHPLLTGVAAENAQADNDAESVPDADRKFGLDTKLGQLVQGIEMTIDEVRKVLRKHGVTPIEPLHQPFDPNLHNALFQVPTEDVAPGTVVSVIKRGYVLHQRVLRAADVGVAKNP